MRFQIIKSFGKSHYLPTIPCLRDELIKNHAGESVCFEYKKACGTVKSKFVTVSDTTPPLVTCQDNMPFDWNLLDKNATGQFYA